MELMREATNDRVVTKKPPLHLFEAYGIRPLRNGGVRDEAGCIRARSF